MNNFKMTPKVDETQEFIEIANDFSNPLELVREAISNAYDARASNIHILFSVVEEYGEKVLKIDLIDDGHGMNRAGLQSFFDLGNSLRRGDTAAIGEKGHGTKVYFNSSKIEVVTQNSGKRLKAAMNQPFRELFDRKIPIVDVVESLASDQNTGTHITIYGYNSNRKDRFTHEQLKDYINWFTKHGSIEQQFNILNNSEIKLHLKGLNWDDAETISAGHIFPNESRSIEKLFDEHVVRAPDHYCKRIVRSGHLRNHPEIKFDAIFSIEGNRVKYDSNPMIRRPGYSAPFGAYTVQQRYGFWLCKDYIPIQEKNSWVSTKGREFTKLHAFLNCQGLRLTANRGSVDNTPSEIMADIESVAKELYNEILDGDDWRHISWLEQEVEGYKTQQREEKDFKWRLEKARRSNVAKYKEEELVEPTRESGVFALVVQLSIIEKGFLPFDIVDYDTHEGIDVIVKGDHTTPLSSAKLYYVEFKHFLESSFNHSFANLHSIVCWDTLIKHDDIVSDVRRDERKMQIIQPETEKEYTRYFLDHPKRAHKIEVYVLKYYLKEMFQIDFRPRGQVEAGV